MDKTQIENSIFDATARLELMQTLLDLTIDTVEEDLSGLSKAPVAVYLTNQRGKIIDLLHIAFNGISDVVGILEKLNEVKEGAA